MTDISIIVPVYKVEDYVARCVRSVAAQKGVSTELVLVDDCGGDGSIALAETTLASLGYANYRILRHEANRGLSAARNTGTAEATGMYIYYLDSDDWLVADDSLATMWRMAEETGAACVVAQYDDCNADTGETLQVPYDLGQSRLLQGGDGIRAAYASKALPVTAWNKLIRRDFLSREGLEFKEGILHEDSLWTFQLMAVLPSLYIYNKVTYHYAINPESIMNKMGAEKFRRREDSCAAVLDGMQRFLEAKGIHSDELSNYIEETRNYMCLKFLVDGLPPRETRGFFRRTFRRLPLAQWRTLPMKGKVLHAYQLFPLPVAYWIYMAQANIQKRR